MTRVVVDAQTWERLGNPHELLEVCDEAGRTLAYYQPAARLGSVEDGKIRSPFSDNEIEERRRQTGDRTLAEFWKDVAGS
jgi:hypothetical protein